jgi:hypothetical protein
MLKPVFLERYDKRWVFQKLPNAFCVIRLANGYEGRVVHKGKVGQSLGEKRHDVWSKDWHTLGTFWITALMDQFFSSPAFLK